MSSNRMKINLSPFAVIIYVKKPILGKFTGYSFGPLILIREHAKDVMGWEVHELTHTRQLYRSFGLHAIMYYLSKKYRIQSELEAYLAQLSSKDPGVTPHYVDVMLQRML